MATQMKTDPRARGTTKRAAIFTMGLVLNSMQSRDAQQERDAQGSSETGFASIGASQEKNPLELKQSSYTDQETPETQERERQQRMQEQAQTSNPVRGSATGDAEMNDEKATESSQPQRERERASQTTEEEGAGEQEEAANDQTNTALMLQAEKDKEQQTARVATVEANENAKKQETDKKEQKRSARWEMIESLFGTIGTTLIVPGFFAIIMKNVRFLRNMGVTDAPPKINGARDMGEYAATQVIGIPILIFLAIFTIVIAFGVLAIVAALG